MEESEKRKERLRVMRMEAARADSSSHPEALPGPGSLANPLIETAGPPSVDKELHAAPRFDYYTDPMSAFSANRRGNNPGSHNQFKHPTSNHSPHSTAPLPSVSGARNLETSSSQGYQWQASYSANHVMYQPHAPQPSLTPHQSPRPNASPSPMHVGVPPQAWSDPYFRSQYTSVPNSGYSPNPSFRPLGRPSFSFRHGSPCWRGNTPRPTGLAPGFGQGRGQWSAPGGGPSFTKSGGRGVGFRGHGSGRGRPLDPKRFYHESMIEDPWKGMVAVVWTSIGAPSTSSWMPQSVISKKPRVAESQNKFGGLNLAEFLAATFKEATDETETAPEP